MKKILLALILTGATSYGAAAQSDSRYAKNYTVCRGEDGTYAVCSNDRMEPVESNYRVSSYQAQRPAAASLPTPCINIATAASPKIGYEVQNGRKIRVYYDETKSKMEP